MSRGEPLNDEDRAPWLRRIREEAIKVSIGNPGTHEKASPPTGLVVACSALKKLYRDVLRGDLSAKVATSTVDGHVSPGGLHPNEQLHPSLPTLFVHLTGSHETLYKRMGNRHGHYMKKNMLDSQIRALEPPSDEEKLQDVIQVDFDAIPDTEAQVEFALSSIECLGKDRPIMGLKEDSGVNHLATTTKAQVGLPG